MLRVSEEGDAHGSHGRGMHSACVGGIEFGHGGEEDIVEVGGFEGHVDKGVKEVPDKEASDLGGTRFGDEDEGTAVDGCEQSCDRGKGEDAGMVE